MNENRLIFVLEGPAGCGKSTLLQKGITDGFWKRFEFKHPYISSLRDHGSRSHRTSSLKDFIRMQEIISMGESDEFYVMDRYSLSQAVYHSIRIGEWNNTDVKNMLAYNLLTLKYLAKEYQSRKLSRGYDRFTLEVVFLLFLPTMDVLRTLRRTSLRGYPFDPAKEIDYYNKMLEILPQLLPQDNNEFSISLQPFFYGSVPQLDQVSSKIFSDLTTYISMTSWVKR